MNGPNFNQPPRLPEQNPAVAPSAGESFAAGPSVHSESMWRSHGDLWDNPEPSSDLTTVIPMEAIEANASEQSQAPPAYDESYMRQHRASRQRESAITSLLPGQKIAMSIPGRGNVLFTRRLEDEAYQAGEETFYRPAYDQVDLNPPQPPTSLPEEPEATRVVNPVRPATPTVQREPFMGTPFGPHGQEATGFGPQGDATQTESHASGASSVQQPEGYSDDPYIDEIDPAFSAVLINRNRQYDRRAEAPAKSEPPRHEVVEVETPAIEHVTPETVQAASPKPDEDLADQLLKDKASPVAEMRPEDRPDMMAVRQPGAPGAAAAAEHAKNIGAEQPPEAQPKRRRAEDEDEGPLDIAELLPDVVTEGEEPPDIGGGGMPRYRR